MTGPLRGGGRTVLVALAVSTIVAPLTGMAPARADAATEAPTATAPAAAVKYRYVDLGALGASLGGGSRSDAVAISERGQVVGSSSAPSGGGVFGYLWENGRMTQLDPQSGADGRVIQSNDVNEAGTIVGWGWTGFYTPPRPVVIQDGVRRTLPTGYGAESGAAARAINDDGFIVGTYFEKQGSPIRAAVWKNGQVQDIGTLGGVAATRYGTESEARDVNNAGEVVGVALPAGGAPLHAFVWRDGVMRDLGGLGGTTEASQANAINERGDVVGSSQAADGKTYATLWSGGSARSLGTLDDGLQNAGSVAYGINEAGTVVGTSNVRIPGKASTEYHAAVWRDGQVYDLNAVTRDVPADLNLWLASSVNDSGVIVGRGCVIGTCGCECVITRAVMLVPEGVDGPPGRGLRASYFSTPDLSGPSVDRVDPVVDFDWGLSAPAPGTPEDRFSVRWTGLVIARHTELYTFTTTSDDGVRLWVDERLVIDQWHVQGPTAYSGTILLSAGDSYSVRLEYFEHTAGATAQLRWSSASQPEEVVPADRLVPTTPVAEPGKGLQAEYYATNDLSGPAVRRVDASIDFDWRGAPPVAGLPSSNFSVRWTGTVVPRADEVTFTTASDDGIRLWIDGRLVIDEWNYRRVAEHSVTLPLAHGHPYSIKIEYFQGGNDAVAKLKWGRGPAQEIVPPAQLLPTLPRMGLRASYFPNKTLSGPAVTRVDRTLDFDWGLGNPGDGLPDDGFSVRWEGRVWPRTTGNHTFYTTSDDGIRLWIDGKLVIDQWNDHGPTEHSGTVWLAANVHHAIKVEYYENVWTSTARLAWSGPGLPKQVIRPEQLIPLRD
ncbi:PA14 domain-containing protein [Motilibacter deserti]|uniref:PA14 domain-containing protein n=1 Tax=Motilibacter deserti TaxID=2714956 RepID=A0ABX0GZ59_9ACTN|nr:PA14 domain-containing protein [Motilibacter deserti]NHC15411.1 hypothetical protein [Motilibacter deserti]